MMSDGMGYLGSFAMALCVDLLRVRQSCGLFKKMRLKGQSLYIDSMHGMNIYNTARNNITPFTLEE